MSNVPLPEPELFYWKPSFVKGESIQIKGYTAEAMHAHAAAVSAAKDKEIERLRAEVAELREDAERLDWLLHKLPGDSLRYVLGELSDTSDEAEFRAAIDAAR